MDILILYVIYMQAFFLKYRFLDVEFCIKSTWVLKFNRYWKIALLKGYIVFTLTYEKYEGSFLHNSLMLNIFYNLKCYQYNELKISYF